MLLKNILIDIHPKDIQTFENKTVLVVDDNEKNLKLFRDLLMIRGVQVVEAINGKQGLEIAEKENLDLIILDWQMPVMSGKEALAKLKSSSKTENIPIIVITASAMREDVDEIRNSGCDDFMNKPIDISEFLQLIDKFLKN